MKKILSKPLTPFLIGALILFLRTAVLGQNANQQAAGSDTEQALRTINLFAQIVGWIAIVAGVIWYVFKAKNLEQIKQARDAWKDVAESREAKNTDLEKDNAKLKETNREVEQENEILKKANLRLQADQEGKK